MSNVTQAVAAYSKAIELNPRYSAAHTNLGNILRARGENEGAIVAYHRAIEAGPTNDRAHFNLGNAPAAAREDRAHAPFADRLHELVGADQRAGSLGAGLINGACPRGSARIQDAARRVLIDEGLRFHVRPRRAAMDSSIVVERLVENQISLGNNRPHPSLPRVPAAESSMPLPY